MSWEIAEQLWIQYYYLTEQFDRRWCSGISPVDGNAIPKNGWENRIIQENAAKMRKILLQLKEEYNIHSEDFQAAKMKCVRFTHEYNEEIYNNLDYRDFERKIEQERLRNEASRTRSRGSSPIRFSFR